LNILHASHNAMRSRSFPWLNNNRIETKYILIKSSFIKFKTETRILFDHSPFFYCFTIEIQCKEILLMSAIAQSNIKLSDWSMPESEEKVPK